jgi:hypothetical protein
LVPPVATSGLAFASGDYFIAMGALLLFGVNVVAIVFAAAFCFWVVGVRDRKLSYTRQVIREGSVLVSILAVALILNLHPLHAPPLKLANEVKSEIGPEYRVIRMRTRRGAEAIFLQLELGGPRPPGEDVKMAIRGLVRKYMPEDIRVHLVYRYETVIE